MSASASGQGRGRAGSITATQTVTRCQAALTDLDKRILDLQIKVDKSTLTKLSHDNTDPAATTMNFVLIALIVAAVIATVLLLIMCIKRYRVPYSALRLGDAAAEHLLLEEALEGNITPYEPEAPASDQGLGEYHRLTDGLPYEDANRDDAKPQRSRHPLAAQFSAFAAAAEPPSAFDPMHTREFQHEMKLNDQYIWSTKGGPASPMKISYGSKSAHPVMPMDNPPQVPEQQETSKQQQEEPCNQPDEDQKESEKQQTEQQELLPDEGHQMKVEDEESIVKSNQKIAEDEASLVKNKEKIAQRPRKGKKGKNNGGRVQV